MNKRLKEALDKSTAELDRALEKCIKERKDEEFPMLNEAELYTVMSGGKRVRPFLTLEFCRALGGDIRAALPFACAVEMVHSYSLIHDDLPCMDNDDMRRGKTANHIKFGYANALLAGDGLLTDAFFVLADNKHVSAEQIVKATKVLSSSAGSLGMVGGQVMDLSDDASGYERLLSVHDKKCSQLICAAAVLGCIAAGGDEKMCAKVEKYARCIGLTFQITDDILDYKNGEKDKTTILSFKTEEEAIEFARRLTEEGKSAIEDLPNNEILCELADYLLYREK